MTTYYALSKKERQDVVIEVTNTRTYFNDKSFHVGFHKHSQIFSKKARNIIKKSSNIFKKATFVRKPRILSVYLIESKQDYPTFELTYFTNVCFVMASLYSDDIFRPKKQIIENFMRVGLT